jgi:hypothetical protein
MTNSRNVTTDVVLFRQELLTKEWGMPVSLVATDYSRPALELLAQRLQTGVVHSVFHRAVNIALDGTMLALLSDELPRMPNGVRLPVGAYHTEMRALEPGMAVRTGDGIVSIPTCGFTLRLLTATPWEPRPDVTSLQWSRHAVAQQRRRLARYLAERAGQEGLASLLKPSLYETPLIRLARPALQALMRAAGRQDSMGVAEAARWLAGLGPGLTPSGDDALAGFAAVMTLLGEQLSADAAPRDVIAHIIAATAGPRTTRLSSVLLNHAACGEVAESLGNLLLALALPIEEGGTVLRAADALLACGATSGADTLLGVLAGLLTLEGGDDDDLYR